MESYEKIKKVLALGFMNFLDENKPKDKMCLSNGECADIEKAFNEKDWPKLERYLNKYTESEDERIMKILSDVFADSGDRFISEYERKLVVPWLEKQKEQKPAERSEEDERILKGIIGKIDHDQTYGVSKDEMLNFLKKL